jgi:peroxiredoxin
MRIATLALAAMLILPAAARGQKGEEQPPRRPSEPTTQVTQPRKAAPILGSVAIGDAAPDFVLESAQGRQVRLSKLRGDWIVLVFSDRGRELRNLRDIDEDLKAMGARLVGVSREKIGHLRSMAQRDTLGFMLLGDVTGQISALYGLYDRAHSEIEPGFVIIDRHGVVRTAVLGQSMEPEQIAEMARISITGIN